MTKRKDEWITVAQAAVIAGCSKQTVYLRARHARDNAKKEGRRRYVRRSWAESLIVGGGGSAAGAQIEGLKTRLAAAEHERDALMCDQELKAGEIKSLHDGWSIQAQHIKTLKAKLAEAEKERDKWAEDHARQKKETKRIWTRLAAYEKERDQAITARDTAASNYNAQIEGLRQRLESHKNAMLRAEIAVGRLEKERDRQRKEIEALKLEIQTYADTYAESKPPAVIDRLVAAVDSAPLETLTQIDKPRHAALRRVVGLWTEVQHAVESFTPGDSAQTTNDDDEVT